MESHRIVAIVLIALGVLELPLMFVLVLPRIRLDQRLPVMLGLGISALTMIVLGVAALLGLLPPH